MGEAAKRMFCPSCGENVDTFVLEREGAAPGDLAEELLCSHCGMLVVDQCKKEVSPVESILICDDSSMIRELLGDVLTKSKLAKKVVASRDGSDFITCFTKSIMEKSFFSLVVLDLAMPVLNGTNAAIAMRAIEKAHHMKPAPILFFTAYKCDENFKKVLSFCKPALYVNKGVSSTPDLLASRISQVVERLLKNSQGALGR
ncbi:MAG: response regulator [Deltaproteobacteria bacterium]|nr:response regulator [Deltaproteobacteria bacterium]